MEERERVVSRTASPPAAHPIMITGAQLSRAARAPGVISELVLDSLVVPKHSIYSPLRHVAMTGPPTPPPSSATEIQDAARTTAPPPALATEPEAPAPAAPVPEQAQPAVVSQTAQKTSYELLFPSIVDLARLGRAMDLIQVLERADLSVCTYSLHKCQQHPHHLFGQADHDKDFTRLLVVAPLVLAYLIEDEMYATSHLNPMWLLR